MNQEAVNYLVNFGVSKDTQNRSLYVRIKLFGKNVPILHLKKFSFKHCENNCDVVLWPHFLR